MTGMDYFMKTIKENYNNFDGRARRSEYWYFTLFATLSYVVVGGIAGLLANMLNMPFLLILVLPVVLYLFIPSLAVAIRRLHDTNKSGWWLLIGLIPYLGGLVLFVFYIMEGTYGPNNFGADPKDPDGGASLQDSLV